MIRLPITRAILLVGFASLASACGEPVQVGQQPGAATRGPSRGTPRPGPGAPPAAAVADAGVDVGVDSGGPVYRDEDFVEVDTLNRDPFRDFVIAMAASEVPIVNPREVLLHDVSVEQMRLIAIITGVAVPYAMVLDTSGVGHVVVRGNYIGRDEVVNVGGADGMPVALNWKVDRIRPGEVVLTREDPLHPEQPPLTRSMLLREAGEDARASVGVITGQLNNTGDQPGSTGQTGGTDALQAPAAPSIQGNALPPPPGSRPGGSYGETTAMPPPPPGGAAAQPAPAAPPSRFGGVFGRRTATP